MIRYAPGAKKPKIEVLWADSSVGRAGVLYTPGHRFESCSAYHRGTRRQRGVLLFLEKSLHGTYDKPYMTLLVTGCAGFIGSACSRALAKRFPEAVIVGIDDLSAGKRDAVPEGVRFFKESILDEVRMNALFAEYHPEYVFHFAALPRVAYSVQKPVLTSQVNIVGTTILLEAAHAHGTKRVIFSSSSAVYGADSSIPTLETASCGPTSPYAAQKLAGEELCRVYSRSLGLDTVCLRYFNVYGPGQRGTDPYSTVIAAWLEAAYFGQERRAYIEGDGSQSRDFCYVDDVVEANILAMQHASLLRGEAVNIASGEGISLRDIRERLEQVVGKPLDLEQRPPRIGDVMHTLASTKKAEDLLGFTAQMSLERGVVQTDAWFRALVA